ncbi:hypothetical protein LAZ67_11001356, partial [Cordylochernes scorpioides]
METAIFTTFPSNQSCLHVADPTPIICSPTISPTHDIEISIPFNAAPQFEHCPHELHRILYEFSHVFSTNKYNVPKLNIPPVKINTTTDKIIALRPYRVPLHDQQEIQTQIEQMLQHGIIAPSVSPYASPITLVTKRDKTKRFCIDYRELNEIIAPDVHPLPLIETILDKLSKAKYYSSVDIASAYWQVEVEPNSHFLGYTVTAGTYAPQTRNLDTISAIKPPTNQKTLQSFLGAVNVYNKFIPDYARLRAPLNKLLKKDVKWNWDPDCQQAFTTLKESLTSKPVLHLYQVGLPCRLYCDASTQGIAGILKQVHPDGQVHPVQYFSRALRAHERNYTVTELECLAIVESVDKFRIYLTGMKFTIYIDHQALQWLKTIKNPSGRLFRWSLRLSTYNYEIHYLKGSQQYEADLLSRNRFVGFVSADIIKQHQPTASPFNIDTNGLHTITRKGVIKIIIPETLQHTLMNKVHQEYNHPGISQMTRIITAQYYWKGISKSIEKFVKSCHTCQIIKRPKGKPYGALGQIPPPQQPFDLISIDTIAGFSKYGHSKTYLHVIVDHLTRYAWTFPSKSTSTLTYIQTLKTVLQQGSPKRLLSDRAPAFTSEKFRKFLITHDKLRLAYLENPKASWTQLVKRVTQTYNNTSHSVTRFPPTYLMFNVIPPDLRTHLNPYPEINIAREIANSRTQNKPKKDKETFDKQHRTPHFEVNDLVLVKNYRHLDTGKLAPYFTGPYKIIEIISPNVVRIDRPNQPLNRDSDTIHVNKLKYYTENVLYLTPPQTRFVQDPQRLSQDVYFSEFNHLTPDIFETQLVRIIPPTSSQPFLHLNPATFERMIDSVLGSLKWNMCLCYLDDIVVYAPTFEEHLRRLQLVLSCIQKAGLSLNHKKCLFGSRRIKILGHLVDANRIHPDPDKVEAVSKFPRPRNISELKSFLGLCSYYRRFIENFADKARSLHDLLKNEKQFYWDAAQEKAFEVLKTALISEPVLGHFDESADTHLHTDASGPGIGAVLLQIQGGKERPIAYASRSLTKAENNYSTTEKECLAVVWSISKFRPYLFDRPFTVVTDHHSLCWLVGQKDPSGRLARWALKLQEFDVTVIYKSGRKHKDADCLSRSPLENDQPSAVMSLTNVDIEQTKDPDLAKIIDNLNSGYTRKEFSIIDGILYKKNYSTTGRPWLMMIPKHLRSEVMADLHDAPTAGHLGFARTYDKVKKRFYWPGRYRTVRQYVSHCRECQRRKKLPRRPAGQLVSITPVEKPFYKVGVDLLGRFPVSKDGNRWIIVCTDYMTRYAITKAIPDGGAIETAKFLVEDVILKHGAPREMVTDRGRNFISQVIKEINALCGIVHRFTTAYHPQTNGLTERFNKTLGDMLSMYTGVEQKDWDQVLPYVTFAYNTAKQEATGYTPFFLVHAREAETYIDAVLPYLPDEISNDYVGELVTRAEEARQLSRSRLLQSQAKDRRLYDQKHTPVYYQKNDLVWVFTPIRKVGLSEKLLKRYFGPYKVTKKLSEVTYEVEPVDPSPRSRKAKDIFHVIRMKPYLDPEEQHSILLGNTS